MNNNTSNQNTLNYSGNRGAMRRSNSRSKLNISTRNSRSKSRTNFNEIFESNVEDKSFENILRKYGGRQITGKVFMNYSKKKVNFLIPLYKKEEFHHLKLKIWKG